MYTFPAYPDMSSFSSIVPVVGAHTGILLPSGANGDSVSSHVPVLLIEIVKVSKF